jgi:hypothetical protein
MTLGRQRVVVNAELVEDDRAVVGVTVNSASPQAPQARATTAPIHVASGLAPPS